MGINFWGLNLLSFVILVILFCFWYKDRSRGWLVIILGGLLNLGERIFLGYVNDYWRIPGTNIYNNVNDYLIFVGGVMVVWNRWKKLK